MNYILRIHNKFEVLSLKIMYDILIPTSQEISVSVSTVYTCNRCVVLMT